MQKEIFLNNTKYFYTLKKSSGRYLRIQVKPGGILEVFKPRMIPLFLAERFLRKKEVWIIEKIEKQKSVSPTTIGLRPRQTDPSSGRRGNKRKEYLERKEEARSLVLCKLKFWQTYYIENFGINFIWKNVAIKNTKTRWGSCSSKKNLNFSYRILELTPEAQDYLIVHELSHLIQMNHSQKFWDTVALGIRNYKILRKTLRKYNIN